MSSTMIYCQIKNETQIWHLGHQLDFFFFINRLSSSLHPRVFFCSCIIFPILRENYLSETDLSLLFVLLSSPPTNNNRKVEFRVPTTKCMSLAIIIISTYYNYYNSENEGRNHSVVESAHRMAGIGMHS